VVNRWKGDFQWVRYRPQDYFPGRGYVGDAVLLSIIVVELDQQKLTHKRLMAQLLVLGVLPRTRSPDRGVRCIRLIRAAGAES